MKYCDMYNKELNAGLNIANYNVYTFKFGFLIYISMMPALSETHSERYLRRILVEVISSSAMTQANKLQISSGTCLFLIV